MRRSLLAGASALILGALVPAKIQAEEARLFEVEVHKDLAYYEGADADPVKHKLDVFRPRGEQKCPVLFFVHGGSWRHGDKNFLSVYSNIGRFYASHGIVTVVINYRLSPKVQHPEHILDVTRAFAWTVRSVAQYGGNPEHIFVSGHSAGAHLVSLMTVDKRYLEEHKLSTKNISGVISVSGIFAIPDGLFTMVFGEDPEKRRQASPLLQARGELPPFLFLYADADLPYCDRPAAEAFCKALKDKGTSATTREIALSNHYTMVTSLARNSDPVSTAILDFIKAHPSKG